MELVDINWWCIPQLVYMFGVWWFVRRQRRREAMHRNELILQYGTSDFSKILDKIMEGHPAHPPKVSFGGKTYTVSMTGRLTRRGHKA